MPNETLNQSGATEPESAIRVSSESFRSFAHESFAGLGVPDRISDLAIRSMIEASLMGIETHGIESLEMYLNHLEAGGLKPQFEPAPIGKGGAVGLWDMHSGFGLAGARIVMDHAIQAAKEHGIYFGTVRNTNHLGACGVYGKMAADEGLIGIVSQQSFKCLSPWGGKSPIIGSSPFAFVAPVEGMFPFYFDCQMASMTRAQVKSHRLSKTPLPEGAAMDSEGRPTTDPEAAWFGQLMPIGRHKGVGFAMVFEILSAVLSGNRFTADIPSVVNEPDKSADSSLFVMTLHPDAIDPESDFSSRMKEYVEYIESSPPIDPDNPPRYPGRREGENWVDRKAHGIPLSELGRRKFVEISERLKIKGIVEG